MSGNNEYVIMCKGHQIKEIKLYHFSIFTIMEEMKQFIVKMKQSTNKQAIAAYAQVTKCNKI